MGESPGRKDAQMKIGIIGAGFIAHSVAAVAIKHGHEVMVSNTRGPETLFSLVATVGCTAGTPEEAARFGDIVLVAIPLKAYRTIPIAPLDGKIVLDANNYCPERDGISAVKLSPSTATGAHVPWIPHTFPPLQRWPDRRSAV